MAENNNIIFGEGTLEHALRQIGVTNSNVLAFGHDTELGCGVIVARGKLVSPKLLDVKIDNTKKEITFWFIGEDIEGKRSIISESVQFGADAQLDDTAKQEIINAVKADIAYTGDDFIKVQDKQITLDTDAVADKVLNEYVPKEGKETIISRLSKVEDDLYSAPSEDEDPVIPGLISNVRSTITEVANIKETVNSNDTKVTELENRVKTLEKNPPVTGGFMWSNLGDLIASYDELVEALSKGGTVTLIDNVFIEDTVVVKKETVLNLNGKSITNDGKSYAIKTDPDVKLTITGNGSINGGATGNNAAVVFYGDGVIENGTFYVGEDADGEGNPCIELYGAHTLEIYGGDFSTAEAYNDKYFVLNKKDHNGGTILMYGGTLVNQDPRVTSTEPNGDNQTTFVAPGYTVEEVHEIGGQVRYTVVKA